MPGRILVDTTPLRESRDFRLLFIGQLISVIGTQLTVVAIPYQVYSMTHSTLQVGAISLAQLFPFLAGALSAGPVGDSVGQAPHHGVDGGGPDADQRRHGRQRRPDPSVAGRALRRQRAGGRPHGILEHRPHGGGARHGRAATHPRRRRHDADRLPARRHRGTRALRPPARHRAASRLRARRRLLRRGRHHLGHAASDPTGRPRRRRSRPGNRPGRGCAICALARRSRAST